MKTRTLGKSGLAVSALGYGCMGLEENLTAADVELTSNDLREIDAAASKIKVQGSAFQSFARAAVSPVGRPPGFQVTVFAENVGTPAGWRSVREAPCSSDR